MYTYINKTFHFIKSVRLHLPANNSESTRKGIILFCFTESG